MGINHGGKPAWESTMEGNLHGNQPQSGANIISTNLFPEATQVRVPISMCYSIVGNMYYNACTSEINLIFSYSSLSNLKPTCSLRCCSSEFSYTL